MFRPLVLLLAVLLMSLTGMTWAIAAVPDVNLGGTLDQDIVITTNDGEPQKFESILKPRLQFTWPGLSLTASARLRGDAKAGLGYDNDHPHWHVELRELYLDMPLDNGHLRLGKQQVVWGQADGLRVLDVVNPLDYREFILGDFEDRRLPLWMLNWEFPVSANWTGQLLWIPDPTPDLLPASGSAFSFTSPKLVPALPSSLPVQLLRDSPPRSQLHDADYGLRLTAFLEGWDISLNYFYHYRDQAIPVRETSTTVARITPTYRRSHLLGGSVANAFGNLTLRAEFGYGNNHYFLTNDPIDYDGVFRSAELSTVVGLDYNLGADLLLSGQLFQSVLEERQAGAVRDTVEYQASLMLQKRWLNDTLFSKALYIQSLNDGDSLLQLEASYELTTYLQLQIGADIFTGSRAGVLGQFDNRDRVTVGFSYSF